MRTLHPHTQARRLATFDTVDGSSGRNEASEEIHEAKKELDEASEEEDEETDESRARQVTVGSQRESNLTKRKKNQHLKNKEKKKNIDSTVIQWMSRG